MHHDQIDRSHRIHRPFFIPSLAFIALIALCFVTGAARLAAQDHEEAEDDQAEENDETKLNEEALAAIKLREIGPALMSGRIADIAIDPENANTWYIGVGSGGVWKTVNAGTTWEPIFDHYGSYSIGCVSVDPSNRNTVWVGTGENVGGRHVGYGDGIYKSLDGGKSFKNMGLSASEHISKILIHPKNPDLIYVAVQGPLWSPGGERGLYQSTDGGENWKQILAKGEYTGVTDVVFDPSNPSVLYAATHQRHRTVAALLNGGPETGIHKSIDGGKTWQELKAGLPDGDKGKIGLAVSHQDPRVVYATIELPGRKGGFWRSANGGASWEKRSDYAPGGTGPHYYQEIYVDPHRFDVIYQANVSLARSEDGGTTWGSAEGKFKHVDNHAVVFHPTDPDFLLVGCDGGLYRSYDRGATYQFFPNLPLTQFYKLDVDYDYPFYNIVGGTQDNDTQYGPSQTRRQTGIVNSDWRPVIEGDGHDCAIDPKDPNIIYGESQKGFLRRYDRRTGQSIDIRPSPEAGQPDLRYNWDAPIHISPHSHTRIYHGSQYLHRSDDRGDSWKAISPDLSRARNRLEMKIMDRVWSVDATYDLYAMSMHGNITSIDESPVVEGLIYVGTDDGLIQVTEDGGANWRRVEQIFGIPEFAFVNDIKADRFDPDTVYAALDNHKEGDFTPYLIKSTDRGRTWENIGKNLPERHLVWRLVQDHKKKELMFAGTEFGLFVTLDGGANWMKLKGGTPNIPFRDIEIQRRENDLVGATFGRSFYVLDDYSFLRHVNEKALTKKEWIIFPVRRAFHYVSTGGMRNQGAQMYTAPNPSYGATFTIYCRDGFESKKKQRQKNEAKINEAGGDVPTPTFEELSAEERERAPELLVVIRDKDGGLVRRLEGPSGAGFHRLAWDLRYGSNSSVGGKGMLAPPGRYSVGLERQNADGSIEPVGKTKKFSVASIDKPSLPPVAAEEIAAFYTEVETLSRSVCGAISRCTEALEQLGQIDKALTTARTDDLPLTTRLATRVRELEEGIRDLQVELLGDTQRARLSEPAVLSIGQRLSTASRGQSSTHGPTATHRREYEIAAESYGKVHAKLRKLAENDLRRLFNQLEKAGVPWTTGRPIPAPKK